MPTPKREELRPIADRIREALRRADLTQLNAAQRLGISLPQMQRYVGCRSAAPVAMLMSIAELTSVDVTWLLTGEAPTAAAKALADAEMVGILEKRVAELEAELAEARKPSGVTLSTAWNALTALGAIVRGEKLP